MKTALEMLLENKITTRQAVKAFSRKNRETIDYFACDICKQYLIENFVLLINNH